MAVDPTGADLKAFLEEDDGEPVVMLNLLRYRDEAADGLFHICNAKPVCCIYGTGAPTYVLLRCPP